MRATGAADYLAGMEPKRRDRRGVAVHGRRPRGMPLLALLAVPLAVLLTACAEEAERQETSPAGSLVAVREFQVGRAVDSTGAVVAPSDSFAPADTVYASVRAEGHVDQAIVTARWSREGGIIVAEEQEVFPLEGRQVVTFPLAKADGLPPGAYRVEIRLGRDRVGEETFHVGDPASAADRPKEPEP